MSLKQSNQVVAADPEPLGQGSHIDGVVIIGGNDDFRFGYHVQFRLKACLVRTTPFAGAKAARQRIHQVLEKYCVGANRIL